MPDVANLETRPDRLEEKSVWTAADFPDPESYRRPLTREMLAELEVAAKDLLATNKSPHEIALRAAPLDATATLLKSAYDDVENGYGFTMLAGMPVQEWGLEVSRAAFCLIGSYFGQISRQNREGEYVVDVTDKSKPLSSQGRGYHSNDFLDYHNDGTNVVALMCMETAKVGGESMLLSAATIYNIIAEERPDLLPELMRGYRHSRRNQAEPGQAPVMESPTPVFSFIDGVFHNCYSRVSIDSSLDQGLVHSTQECEALDFFDEVMSRPGLALPMEFRIGDIQLVNNFTLLHSRKAYLDHNAERRRHLLRLWLTDPSSKYNGPGKMDFYMPAESRFLQTRGYEIFR
ncbi:MAG: TauD/TfdA family dioxygenase [Burkholderiaceae bacterium]